MANNCRAKHPDSCRVHGNGGELDQLQKSADSAVVREDLRTYFIIRAKMDALTDDEPAQFIAPDRGEFNINAWKYSSGNIMPEVPNDTLIANLYQSSIRELPDTGQVVEMLERRGYKNEDLVLAKHFRFGKDDNSSTSVVTARKVSRLTEEIENNNKVKYPPATKEAFVRRYFNFTEHTQIADRAHCKKFVEDYTKFLADA